MKKAKKMMFLLVLFCACCVTMTAKAATSTKTSVKKRADGGIIETKITTTVTKKVVGKKTYVTTKIVTKVTEKSGDGFIEVERTTTEVQTEEFTNNKKTKTTNKKAMYKDVTKKKVGIKNFNAVKYLKAHGAFSGVVKGKRFYPNKRITKKQYLRILRNCYGNAAPKDAKASGYVTEKYALTKLVQVAKNLGIRIRWKGRANRLTRVEAARYIKIFIDFDPVFKRKLIH